MLDLNFTPKGFIALTVISGRFSAMMVFIFGFAVGFGRFLNKNRGSRSVSVFMVV